MAKLVIQNVLMFYEICVQQLNIENYSSEGILKKLFSLKNEELNDKEVLGRLKEVRKMLPREKLNILRLPDIF